MSSEVSLGSTVAGFRVERLIGRGAMGAVYLTEDVHLRRKVALKVLAPELSNDDRFRRRFLLESQLAASLEHPHIVPIYAAGEVDGDLYLAMKYVEGYDLRELLDSTEPVDDERALRLLGQVAAALDAAHGLGLVHRDVKPANILIGAGDEEHAYVCDFGLAKVASSVSSLTGERAFVGTIAYIAPEQIEGGAIDARADVYSLACMLYETLTGEPPFDREGDLQVVFAHLKEPAPLVTALRPDLPDAVNEILATGLAKEPDDRYSTGGELLAAAAEALKVAAPVPSAGTGRTIQGVHTFLITDIRGYTSYTQEHGDEAAAALASSFADLVRVTVEERDGRLIELRGDEALVVFDSPRQALRAAVELQRGVEAASLPRGIGIGLDAGEAVPVGEGYRGGALNLAARLCSLAAPGEILASETVQTLARAVEGLRYGERRVERLKGMPRPVPLVEIVPEDRRVRKLTLRRLRRQARGIARSRRGQLIAAAVLVAAVAAGTFLALAGKRSVAGAQIPPNSLGLLNADGDVTGKIPVGGKFVYAVHGAGGFWAVDDTNGTIGKIDFAARTVRQPLITFGINVGRAAAGAGFLWVEDENKPTLIRIDPRYRTKTSFALPADQGQIDTTAPQGLAVCGGSVWVATANKVFRVNPNTGAVKSTIDVPGGTEVDCGDGAVWVTSAGYGTIKKINPAIDQVVNTITLHDWMGDLQLAGGFLWASIIPDDTIWKIDTNGHVLQTLSPGRGIGGPAVVDGHLWVPLGREGRLARIDPSSNAMKYFRTGGHPDVASAGPGVLLLSVSKGPRALTPLPADQVATFSLAEDYLDDIDPATAWPSPYRAQLEYATGVKLLNYPDTGAPKGTELQPEVAAAMPRVTDGGRTYTFRIRPGFTFSPPSNKPVTAAAFKYTLERTLSPKLGRAAPAFDLIGDIAGAKAFHEGHAAHVSGIVAAGDTLTIHLSAPAGDFPARLSLPFFAAVPIGTPIISGGVQQPIPSAGPYYITEAFLDERLVLERNPNYHGPRPHNLQRIVYDLNNSTHRTVSQINSGGADYTADLREQSAFARGGSLDRRFGHGADPRFHLTPQLGLQYVQLNTGRGLFKDARMRRAVAYAIDRNALTGVNGGAATSQYVPPGTPGYFKSSLYPLGPDLARARRLAGGGNRSAVLYTCSNPDCGEQARILKANLAAIGIDVAIRSFDDPYSEAFRPGAGWDLLLAGWGMDWPDPSAVFDVLVSEVGFRPSWSPPAALSDQHVSSALTAANLLLPPKRYAAYRRVEKSLLSGQMPLVPYETPVVPEFFSARIGCKVFQPVVQQVDIGALCVKSS